MTLVELLVVVATVGVIVALILPAAQAARESARRTVCIDNLRNIGCALHGHLIAKGVFPAGCVEWRVGGDRSMRQLAWSAFILPWLEEQAVADRLELSKAFDDAANADAAAAVLPVFRCPSVTRPRATIAGRGACDYGGIYGERLVSPNNPPKGAFLIDRTLRTRDIADGLSKTVFVGEDCGFDGRGFPDGQWINGRNIFDQAYPINAAPAVENDMRSRHPGGVVALLGDGAARFLRESLDRGVLAGLCTRAGADRTE